jgi:dihydroxy-acid dehydratase
MLVVRGAGPIAYPGSAEVVNMMPPGDLVNRGVTMLPCLGDGRQSGTSDSPSILNASPEAAVGGNLAILQTGDLVKVDLGNRRVDLLLSEEEIEKRRMELVSTPLKHDSPWQELYRRLVGQLDTRACLEFRCLVSEFARRRAPAFPIDPRPELAHKARLDMIKH